MPTLQFSCPCCSKKYSVKREKIKTSQPQFQCSRCQAQFFMYDSNELGIGQTELIKAGPRAVICPKCGSLNSSGHEECRVCGIVFSKYSDSDWQMPHSSKGLEREWRGVLNDYENPEVHKEFISICRENGALAFAMQKYQSLIDLIPGDEVAAAMKGQIRTMVTTVETGRAKVAPKIKSRFNWAPVVIGAPLLIGLILFVLGVKSYEFRNFAGLGAGILIMTIGVLTYFRK